MAKKKMMKRGKLPVEPEQPMAPVATLILVFRPAPDFDLREFVQSMTDGGHKLFQSEVRIEPVERPRCRCQMVAGKKRKS